MRATCTEEVWGCPRVMRFVRRWGCPRVSLLAGFQDKGVRMKLFKVLFVFLLLGGDYGLEPASLQAFPQQPYGCDGRVNLLCAPMEPFLLRRPHFSGGVTLLLVAACAVLRGISVTAFGSTKVFFKHWFVL